MRTSAAIAARSRFSPLDTSTVIWSGMKVTIGMGIFHHCRVLEEADHVAVGVDVDVVTGGSLWEPGHGAHVPA